MEQGGVIYVALEGSYGLKNRVSAFKNTFGNETDGMPFAMITTPINFLDPNGNIMEFLEVIKEIKVKLGSVSLIVIDTLARAMAGGEENSGQDMGVLVHHGDMIKAVTGAHICFVHHSGKDKALGARGHSSLRAAVDTEIEVSRGEGDNYSTVKVVKQREMDTKDPAYFRLQPVTLGINKYNEEVTSCVVEAVHADDIPAKGEKRESLNAPETMVFDSICNTMISHSREVIIQTGQPPVRAIDYNELRLELHRSGIAGMLDNGSTDLETLDQRTKQRTQQARLALRKKNKIGFNDHWIWILT